MNIKAVQTTPLKINIDGSQATSPAKAWKKSGFFEGYFVNDDNTVVTLPGDTKQVTFVAYQYFSGLNRADKGPNPDLQTPLFALSLTRNENWGEQTEELATVDKDVAIAGAFLGAGSFFEGIFGESYKLIEISRWKIANSIEREGGQFSDELIVCTLTEANGVTYQSAYLGDGKEVTVGQVWDKLKSDVEAKAAEQAAAKAAIK
jgi:hypothetical protein